MHHFDDMPAPPADAPEQTGPWWKEPNRYQWFVLIVAALGWLFDTMDQQFFTLGRAQAMADLLRPSPTQAASPADVAEYAGYATSIFLIGWGIGGVGFGILGDRIGRAKTMIFTILSYSMFTGLSALSQGFWDFALYRFLTGLGVGGQFGVGVSLVAETMPMRARPFALGLLQALSAIGNIAAALTVILLGQLEKMQVVSSPWRYMFMIGTMPALIAIFVARKLKEPEQWKAAAAGGVTRQLGSVGELFSNLRWRKNALVGLALASSGVIGLWAIGFFSYDLNRSIFRKSFEGEARQQGEAEWDRQYLRLILQSPKELAALQGSDDTRIRTDDLLNFQSGSTDARPIFETVLTLEKEGKAISEQAVMEALAAKNKETADAIRESGYLQGPEPAPAKTLPELAKLIVARAREINGRLTLWAQGITSIMMNLGGFFGVYAFTYVTQWLGRKPSFAISSVIALLSTAMVFWLLESPWQIFWMIPLMGFCQLSLFGGYAIYLPELFPTRLRSTGVSFCYNVGRVVAAFGPTALGLMTKYVYAGYPEPMRYAGVTMCSIFLLGLIVLPFAPETKGKPLPE